MKYIISITGVAIIGIILFVLQGVCLPKEAGSEKTSLFLIERGEGMEAIGRKLKERGIIKHEAFFILYVLGSDKSKSLKAGEYELSPSMAVIEIAEKMFLGEVAKERITLIEGWTLKDISDYLREKGIEVTEEIDKNLEGYLFPDTYEISSEDAAEDIVEMMRNNFDKKVNRELREEIASQGKSLNDIVIMASLIEKEVRTYGDKQIVSGLLWKRIKSGMPLQVDATVSYITGRKTTRLTKEELAIDSPYNTYKYRGLPIGPICNPGLESIMAAAYPVETSYWFYLSTPEGETIFSRNLAEHNKAIQKYLK